MTARETSIPGVLILVPDLFEDDRGFFQETYHREWYAEHGLTGVFVQDNHSHSRARVLRGLHYQLRRAQAKLVSVLRGSVFDVAVDIRTGSPTFGKWVGQVLSGENRLQLYIPEGFAHGFCVLGEEADVTYKCTDYYSREDDYGILWSDPGLAIDWPEKWIHPRLGTSLSFVSGLQCNYLATFTT